MGGSNKGRVAVDAVHPAEHPSQGSRLHLQELFLLQLGQQLVHPEHKEMSITFVLFLWRRGGGIEAVLMYSPARLDLHESETLWRIFQQIKVRQPIGRQDYIQTVIRTSRRLDSFLYEADQNLVFSNTLFKTEMKKIKTL